MSQQSEATHSAASSSRSRLIVDELRPIPLARSGVLTAQRRAAGSPSSIRSRFNFSISEYGEILINESATIGGSAHRVAPEVSLSRIPVKGGPELPLCQKLSVSLTPEGDGFVAGVRGIHANIHLSGKGTREEDAVADLGRHLIDLVRRLPHECTADDETFIAKLDSMIDWIQYDRENPLAQPFWGRIDKRSKKYIHVHWIIGPGGIKDQDSPLAYEDAHPSLSQMDVGQYFRATVKEFPDRLEWVSPPYVAPDPFDSVEREKAWNSIEVIRANQPNVWPTLKDTPRNESTQS